jgi:Transposase IS116/IS110/IS902 family
LIAFGHPCPVSDLFGHAGRELLDRLAIPDPWRANIEVSLRLIDDLELQIAALTVQLKRQGADHRYIPLLVTAPGLGWINASTVASEIGDIARFPSPAKLCGYTGLCPRVKQSGATDARGPLSKERLGVPALSATQVGLAERGWVEETPLWFYILKEAELLHDGDRLGPVGGRIVGEVLVGIIDRDPESFRSVDPDWAPTLPARHDGDFGLGDILAPIY